MNSTGSDTGARNSAPSAGDRLTRTDKGQPSVGKWRPYIPQDRLTGAEPDFALAADLVELTALLSPDNRALIAELGSALEIGQDEYEDLDEVVRTRDRITDATSGELWNLAHGNWVRHIRFPSRTMGLHSR